MSQQPQQPQTINIADLDVAQLADIKKQLDEARFLFSCLCVNRLIPLQELNHLTSSFAQLKQAQAKFKTCIDNIGEVKPQNKDKVILVPLTNSLYVPGKLSDTEHVIVDVGTGYFVKKTRPQAIKYYEEKVDYLKSNLETLEDTIGKKRESVNYIVSVLQAKIQAQSQPTKS
ncbi:putative prefoldin subunit 5 [Leucoagaricus sp. SymC.cos]|nr:putative prefoldin subunit 5 [Leucoagaricus sp. SymC.cos]